MTLSTRRPHFSYPNIRTWYLSPLLHQHFQITNFFTKKWQNAKQPLTMHHRHVHVGDATSPTFNVNSALTRLSKFPVLHFWILFWFIQTIISLWYHQFCCKYCVRWKINLFPSIFFHFFLRGRWLHNDLVKLQGYVTGRGSGRGGIIPRKSEALSWQRVNANFPFHTFHLFSFPQQIIYGSETYPLILKGRKLIATSLSLSMPRTHRP